MLKDCRIDLPARPPSLSCLQGTTGENGSKTTARTHKCALKSIQYGCVHNSNKILTSAVLHLCPGPVKVPPLAPAANWGRDLWVLHRLASIWRDFLLTWHAVGWGSHGSLGSLGQVFRFSVYSVQKQCSQLKPWSMSNAWSITRHWNVASLESSLRP